MTPNKPPAVSFDPPGRLLIVCYLPGCNNEFSPHSKLQRFCCPEHKKEWERRLYKSSKQSSHILLTGRLLVIILSIFLFSGCSNSIRDCSNYAAQLNAQYEAQGVHVLIAVCPVKNNSAYHAYLIKGTEIIDAVTEDIVLRSLQGCIIFDEPETLRPYTNPSTYEREWKY